MATASASAAVVRIYRELFRYAKQSNDKKLALEELRTSFRQPIAGADDSLEHRLQKAESRLSFLRMTSTRPGPSGANSGRWIYKDGQKLENVNGTLRDGNGRVVSNWSGNNLDPQSVSTHRKQLRRMGFRNNAHAKGFF